MRNNKKAQMKIQQMAFMLIAITVLFGMIAVIFVSFQLSNLKQGAESSEEKNALLLVSKLSYSPEFSCGDVFITEGAACVDGDKVMALIENKQIYRNFWGVSNIEIRKVLSEGDKVCTMANYPNCDTIRVIDNEIEGNYYSNFVVLCSKQDVSGELVDKCELSMLMASYKPVEINN